jgi:methylamine dehydrogenase accessory protein MauD
MEGWWIASYVVLWALVIVLCVVVVALARQIGTLHLRLGPRGALEIDDEGPPLGEAPPPLEVSTVDGRAVTLGGPGREQLLMFVTPSCLICNEVLPAVRAVSSTGRFTPYVITDATAHEARDSLRPKVGGTTIVADPKVPTVYAVPGTPYVVVVDGRGIVQAKGTVNNLEQVEGLIDTALKRMDLRTAELDTA